MMVKPRESLIGQKFGKLTVIKQVEDYVGKNGMPMAAWECRCDCGNIQNKIVPGTWLKQGRVKSCGCLHNSKNINYGENTYEIKNDYVLGCDMSGNQFFIDKEDLEKVKKYYWSMDVNGYISANERKIKLHRFLMNCNDLHLVVDHINHIKHDNRKCNLRISSRQENLRNMDVMSHNTSGVTGVCWHKSHNKWFARITINKKQIQLGYFDNFEDAVRARKEAEEKYFGEYSYDNSMKISKTNETKDKINMDVTMCTGNCPISDNCYRYMATPNQYGQTYSYLEGECIPKDYDLFVPYETKEEIINYTLDDFILDEIKKNQ